MLNKHIKDIIKESYHFWLYELEHIFQAQTSKIEQTSAQPTHGLTQLISLLGLRRRKGSVAAGSSCVDTCVNTAADRGNSSNVLSKMLASARSDKLIHLRSSVARPLGRRGLDEASCVCPLDREKLDLHIRVNWLDVGKADGVWKPWASPRASKLVFCKLKLIIFKFAWKSKKFHID